MRLFLALLLALPAFGALSTISDTLYSADGSTNVNGSMIISWPTFTTNSGAHVVPSGYVRAYVRRGVVVVDARGVLIGLEPNDIADQANIFYTAKYDLSTGTPPLSVSFTETWVVPTSVTPLKLKDVRSIVSGGGSSSLPGVLSVNTNTGFVTLFTVNPKTTTYQVTVADFKACSVIPVASGTFTITLVASGSQPPNGQCIDILNYGSGVVTVARSGQLINGAASNLTIAAGSPSAPNGLHVWSNGTNYYAEPNGSGGSQLVLNVKDYGATGNGSTDDTAAIQAAITACPALGGQVFFPSGLYKISSTLTYGNGSTSDSSTVGGCSFVGAGVQGTTADEDGRGTGAVQLLWYGSAGGTMFTAAGPLGGLRVQGITFAARGNGSTRAATCLNLVHIYHSTYKQLTCKDFSGVGYLLTAYPSPGGVAIGSNENLYEQLSYWSDSTSAIGLQVGGTSFGSAPHLNVAGNQFVHVSGHLTGASSVGIDLNFEDNNSFWGSRVLAAGTALRVSVVAGNTAFPAANYFYDAVLIGGVNNTLVSGTWTGDAPIYFWPWSDTDAPVLPSGSIFAGTTTKGIVFGSLYGTDLPSSILANLPAARNGTLFYCPDCSSTSNPCTGSSTGAIAKRLNGAWDCSGGGGGGSVTWKAAGSTVVTGSIFNVFPLDGVLTTTANNPAGTFELQIGVDRATVPTKISSGTIALRTTAIASTACAVVVSSAATGVLTSDIISFTPNADITAVTGYAPVTAGGLAIYPYPTANFVNFVVCNPTSSSITPGAVSLNWIATR